MSWSRMGSGSFLARDAPDLSSRGANKDHLSNLAVD